MVQDKMVIPPELVDHIFNAEMDEAFEEDLKNLQVKLAFVDAGVGSWVGTGGFSAVTQSLFRGGNGRVLGQGEPGVPGNGEGDWVAPRKSRTRKSFSAPKYSHRAADKLILAACGGQVSRVREWLLTNINLLKKPQTNLQSIQ